MLLAAEVVLGKDKANKLLDDTVKGRIDELFQDIKDQLLSRIKKSLFLLYLMKRYYYNSAMKRQIS